MEITEELRTKAQTCKTAEELLALATDNDIELTPEEAELFLRDMADVPEGELADDELEDIAGGGGCAKAPNPYEDVLWDKKEDVQFIFNVGDVVQAFAMGCTHHTATCRVTNRAAREVKKTGVSVSGVSSVSVTIGYADYYYLEKVPGGSAVFCDGWNRRSDIEK